MLDQAIRLMPDTNLSSGLSWRAAGGGGGSFSAEIFGFDFDALREDQLRDLRSIWLHAGVVRFRGYDIDDEQQLGLTAKLGTFVKHPRQMKGEEGAHTRYEEILVISNAERDGKPMGTMANTEADWHTDTYIYDAPPAAAILRAVQLPREGGNTYFVNMYEVYEALPLAVLRLLDGRMVQLDTVFDGAGRVRKGMTKPGTDDIRRWPAIRHPIVRTHAESGRNCLYLGGDMPGTWVVGLPLDESRAVLDEIFSYLDRPEFQWTQIWQDGDMIMWDNRCTMHRRDGWPADQIRIMHRTTTEGERPHFVL